MFHRGAAEALGDDGPHASRLLALVRKQLLPRPAREALATLDSLLPEQPRPTNLLVRACLLAMLDRIDEAWAVALPAGERAFELGIRTGGIWLSQIASLAGDYSAAAAYMRDACEAHSTIRPNYNNPA